MYIHSMKGKLIFLIGFIIGFFITFVFYLIINNNNNKTYSKSIDNYEECNDKTLALCNIKKYSKYIDGKWLIMNINTKKLEYKKWLEKNNVTISNIDMDYQQYGKRFMNIKKTDEINNINDNNNNALLESNWLEKKIHIICIVLVNKLKLAKSINDTWASRCNRIYYFGQELNDTELPVIKLPIKLKSSWQFLCEIMHYVWELENKLLEWTIFIKDDTMILLENLRYFVAGMDYNDPYYLGHPIVLWGQAYNVAQAGYVLSRGAYKKIIETFDNHDKCISGGRYWKKEDFYLGKHLSMFNIHPLDTRDYRMRGIFHGYSLQILLWGVAKPSNYFTRALYPPDENNCCSPKSITFIVAEPDKLYTLNYILYHLNVYNSEGLYGNKLAPTSIPENEIWKLALKDEFNITYYDNITQEHYYEIWRSRYSEPSQFINRDYQNIPGILSSILTAYEFDRQNSYGNNKSRKSSDV